MKTRLLFLGLLLAIGSGPASAITIDLTPSANGTLNAGQPLFFFTRSLDATVVAASDQLISSMTLRELSVGSATSVLVGARIYDATSESLLASADTTVSASGSVTIPISVTVASGQTVRLGFYVEPTPGNVTDGSAVLFNPTSSYTESSGTFSVSATGWTKSGDEFPNSGNVLVPQVTIEATAVPEPATLLLAASGLAGLASWRCWSGRKRGETRRASPHRGS